MSLAEAGVEAKVEVKAEASGDVFAKRASKLAFLSAPYRRFAA